MITTAEQETVFMIKGVISEMPEADQKKVRIVADELREIVKLNELAGILALALVGAESAL